VVYCVAFKTSPRDGADGTTYRFESRRVRETSLCQSVSSLAQPTSAHALVVPFVKQREPAFRINYRGFSAFAAILWDETGSGSCPVAELHVSCVEPSGCATRAS
jgi:hypothetical protein